MNHHSSRTDVIRLCGSNVRWGRKSQVQTPTQNYVARGAAGAGIAGSVRSEFRDDKE